MVRLNEYVAAGIRTRRGGIKKGRKEGMEEGGKATKDEEGGRKGGAWKGTEGNEHTLTNKSISF